MVIPNIVTKFQNFDIFEQFVIFFYCRLLTPTAWKGLTVLIKRYHQVPGKTHCHDKEIISFEHFY